MQTSCRIAAAAAFLIAAAAPAPGAAQETAGYNRGFFVRSADGANELRIGGTFQYRYVRSGQDEGEAGAAAADASVGGFQYRRLQVDVTGHFMSPRWTYRLRLDGSNGGTIAAAHAWVAYDFPSGLNVRVGQTKPSFLFEENVSGVSQLAAERSWTADYFTTDFAQLVQLTKRAGERLTLIGTLHTGSYSARTDFDNDLNDFAVTGRAEVLLAGKDATKAWGQFGDFQSWKGDQSVALLGAAVDYEAGESGGAGAYPDVVKWTVDLNVKGGRGALFASAVGQRFSVAEPVATGVPAGLDGTSQLGFVTHATWFLSPDRWAAFARFEATDFNGAYFRWNQGAIQGGSRVLADDRLRILTGGATCHIRKQNAKLTFEVVRALDGVPVANTGSGLVRADGRRQTAVQAQLQIRF